MADAVAYPATPVGDYLTRKLLRRSLAGKDDALFALLEQLATDSVYVLRDDFDRGFDDRVWVQDGPPPTIAEPKDADRGEGRDTTNLDPNRPSVRIPNVSSSEPNLPGDFGRRDDTSGGRGFVWHPEWNGVLVGTAGNGPRLALMSKYSTWDPGRRCLLQGRMFFSTVGGSRFEFGFADETSGHISDTERIVQTKGATPTIVPHYSDFAVLVRDAAIDTSTDLVARSGRGTAALVAQSGPSIIESGTWLSFTIALNEQNEARFWINGTFAGVNRSSARRDAALSIWFATEGSAEVKLDYIHARQERSEL